MDEPEKIEVKIENRKIIHAYDMKEKVVRPGTSSGGRIYVPPSWEGHRVAVILLEPLDEDSSEDHE